MNYLEKQKKIKTKELNDMIKRYDESDDKKEIELLEKLILNIKKELEELEKELEKIGVDITSDEVRKSSDWIKVNKTNINHIYNNNASNSELRKIYTSDNIHELGSNLYLRKGERFSSRFKQNDKKISFAKTLKGIGLGIWEEGVEKRAIGTSSFGAIIPSEVSSQVIENSLNNSLFFNSDVPVVPMPTGSVVVPRVNETMTKPGFKKEGEEGQELSMTLDPVNLNAKTCYGYVYLNNELLMRSDQESERIINETFSKAIAETVDNACIYSQIDEETNAAADYAPKGVWDDESINQVVVSSDSNIDYDTIIDAIAKIEDNNYIATNLGISSENKKALNKLKDNNLNYLQPPKCVEELNKITTNQLKNDNLIVYNNNALLIGLMNNLIVKRIEDTKAVKNNQTCFTFAIYMDFAVTTPKAVCKIYKETAEI